ncbi:serine/threonine-protein phosphatase 6 regulatory ankyrin repeat subunit B-like [Actinia tenebrosa]|uniref:Serine/threonine-protein phosphatase 6 regulatory ankyrin repeat subunit B-like n=1 Tax=Actinia tenebrosa TaxID=6105 RepID=A0A6P8J4Q3_ACTTE|nr:serine/threonine-protein phosphatase 6 regulatory ankyrin repeat subunit B-like [Actinia tenebrosa]
MAEEITDSSDGEFNKTLFHAIKYGKEELVQKLIECGADVNATDEDGRTALFYAVQKKKEKIVEKLIQCGADINATDETGETPLLYAVENGNEKMVKKLIECGADVNVTNRYGGTPLFYAVQKENEKIVEKLIECGTDVNATIRYGGTLLFYAVNEKVVQKLIQCGADVNATDEDGSTALFYAVNEKVVQKLIQSGADVNATNIKGFTALFFAVEKENEKIVEKLKNEKIVEKLIKRGADVNATDEDGSTALFYAVNEKLVQKLIECGADVNVTNKNDETVLFDAVEKENEKMVEKLIECGADVNAMNKVGKTALFYAVQKENEIMVEKLIQRGADVNVGRAPLFYAIQQRNNENIFRALIDAGADVNITNDEGKTALFYAVQKKNESVVRAMIDADADVNITDNEGKTALFFVNSVNDPCVRARILIGYGGAQVDVRDRYGRTPLFYAMTQSLQLARYLLDKEATLHLNENCSVLTFFIEKCIFCSSQKTPDIQDGLNLLSDCKEVERNIILGAIASVAFCKTLYLKPGSRDIDVDSLSHLMRIANENASNSKLFQVNFSAGKIKTISEISTMIHKESHDKHLIESGTALEVTRRLIKLGANPNTTDSDGNTALHHATQLAFHDLTQETVMEICQQLVEKFKASFHVTNHENETPLLYCLSKTIEKMSSEEEPWPAVQTQAAVCRFLVEHGSSVEARNRSEENVLQLTIKLLQNAFFKRNSELRKDISEVAVDLLKLFVDAFKRKEVSINTQDNSGNTPLHLWAKLQLAPGQDYKSKITEGQTSFQGLLTMILDYFKEYKMLHVKNGDGETPLHLCRTWAAVEFLLDAGANPNDVDSSGRSPLLVAATNNDCVCNQGSLYPDIFLASDTEFWRTTLKKGLNPWTVDIHGESVLSVLLKSDSHDLARALVDAACDKNSPATSLVFFSLLTTICKDKLPNAHWKKDAAEMILSSTKCPVNGNDNEDSPLHYCCRNIVEAKIPLSFEEVKTTVHWNMATVLLSFGADYRIHDASGQSCLDIAKEYPVLKDLLMEPIDLDRFPVLIKPWKSVSKTHERCLAYAARHLESENVESYWYHKDHLASGSFGVVFAGINEKDGREVAIKRIEKIRMQRPEDKREITTLTALANCEQVVFYLHFFEDKHFSYIVLELMEGNLDQFLITAIQMETKVSLCQDIVQGLKFLHDQSILHRDLKPTNILYKMTPKLCLKIADFGLSRRMDNTGSSTSVYGPNAGTRCWIAPEVLTSTKVHSNSSDVFACGLVLHYILSVKKHPFSPRIGALQHEIEVNILNGNMEGWDDSLCPEAAHLLKAMLDRDESKRSSADKVLHHSFFWSKKKKLDLLVAVGNQPEFECPRAKRTLPLTVVETDLETSFGTIVKYGDWNDPGYAHIPAIYTEMTKKRKRYDTRSVVELVRFIRNAYAHISESTRPTQIRKQLLEDFVFLEYFPNLVMEVYKAVTTHGWDQTRTEIKFVLQ